MMILLSLWLILSLSAAAPLLSNVDKEATEEDLGTDDIARVDIVNGDGMDSDGLHNHTSQNSSRDAKHIFYGGDINFSGTINSTGDHASINIGSISSQGPHDEPDPQGCPPDETITRECMCGSNSCAKGSVCASGSTCTLPDCKYRYREVPSDCHCWSLKKPGEGEVCTTKGVCTNANGCYSVCEPGKVTDYGCYCKEEKTGGLSQRPCPIGSVCLPDGHCHYDFEVSGVSTQPITASFGSTLWTNQRDIIKKMPEELINSILFQPKDLVAEATIQLSSLKDATVFLALHEDQDGGLKELLPKQDWKLKYDDEGNWIVEYMDYLKPNKGELKIWYQKIEENKPITFTTNEDGAKFVIFFSTDCEENPLGNCLCKRENDDRSARTCKTGQGCKDGVCHDLPQKVGRK